VVAIIKEEKEINKADKSEKVFVITDVSTFYGEAGGQQGDRGKFFWNTGEADVLDTKKYSDIIIHEVEIIKGILKKDMIISLDIDFNRRKSLAVHHSATHLLHEALRRCLGEHVTQKGSMVFEDRLRFDISHNQPIKKEEIMVIENDVNSMIRANGNVNVEIMNIKKASKSGALALFGEKYGEEVRVVSMEDGTTGSNIKTNFSVELCGGTHVSKLGDIGFIKIISDSALGSGVRRIEAVAGEAGIKHVQNSSEVLNQLTFELKVSQEKIMDRVLSIIQERKSFERQVGELSKKLTTSASSQQKGEYVNISGIKVIHKILESVASKDLKAIVDEFKLQIREGIVIIIGIDNKKASIVVGVTEKLIEQFDASDLVKIGVSCLGGKGGGGRKDMAQGGGPNYSNAQAAIEKILSSIKNLKA
jgi:alanyl-tRNA synthetase